MQRLISVLFSAMVLAGLTWIVIFSINQYFSIPVVKITPDGNIVAVLINGKNFNPEDIEIGDRYIKSYVSFNWKNQQN